MAAEDKFQNNQKADPSFFAKGMQKDVDPRFMAEGNYLHAVNAVLNTHQGDVFKIGNEPSTIKCSQIPYTLIGSIELKNNSYAVFSTNDVDSEIGIFDPVRCTYEKLVNDKCLKFKTTGLIRGGVSKENYDCTESIYWNDSINPARHLNITHPPYIKTFRTDPEGGCDIETDTKNLDCEALRLTPLLTVPDLSVNKSDGGNLPNGAYRVSIAYSSKGIRLSDFLTVSNPQFMYHITGSGGGIEITINNLDQDFQEYELILISTVNQQTTARRIGFYNTSQDTVFVDELRQDSVTIDLGKIPLQSLYYEGGEGMYKVNQYLVQTAVRTRKEFNYQPLANKIRAKWVAYAVPETYYRKGGNKIGYTKGETVAFYIRFVYNTGHRSSAFPLVGREATSEDKRHINNADALAYGQGDTVEKWEMYDTSSITRIYQPTADSEYPIMEGDFGYYESEEEIPNNREVWGSMSCRKRQLFRFPDNGIVPNYDPVRKKVQILGFRIENIAHPLDENGNRVDGIVGYEILRADREGNRDIVAKGVIYNTGEYESPTSFNEKEKTLYPNYPLNDLRIDPFLSQRQVKGGCQGKDYKEMGTFSRQVFTFHSPETSFANPSLGSIMKIEAEYFGKARGHFEPVFRHPKTKLIRDFAFFASAVVGIGEGILAISGKKTYHVDPTIVEGSVEVFGVGAKSYKPLPLISSLFSSGSIGSLLSSVLKGKGSTSREVEETAVDKIPLVLKIASSAVLFTYYFAQGTQKTLEIIKQLIPFQQYAYQYNAEALYTDQSPINEGHKIRRIEDYSYLYPGYQEFDGYRVNNNLRESSIIMKLNSTLRDPFHQDNTRQTVGTQKIWDNPTKTFETNTSAYYVSIRKKLKSQYGQVDSGRIVPTGSKVFEINTEGKSSSDIIFGGDTVIDEFSLKRKMHFFNETAYMVPDGYEFDYRLYPNIEVPRYWVDSHEYDISQFFRLTNIQLPNDQHYLDRKKSDCTKKLSFVVKQGYFYLYNSAVVRFFVESSYNLPCRENSTTDEAKKFYDKEFTTDLHSLFRSDVMREDNYFKIDKSLSPIKQLNLTYAQTQLRDFSIENARCFAYEPNKMIYSLPSNLESKRDTWRNFLVNNYLIFPKANGKISTIKEINRTGILYLFENSSAKIHNGTDELQTDAGVKINVGDGGLFAREPQNIANSDYEFSECQSGLSVVSTQYGVFFMSQRQGKILHYTGQVMDISVGLKWWLAEQLPSKLLKQFPNFELYDNPVVGIGCLSIFDNTNEVLYFSKKDYQLKSEFLERVEYISGTEFRLDGRSKFQIGDPRYFDDASWTISYDPKIKAWVSFHDWHPDWFIQGKNHFMTFKGSHIWKHNESIDSYCNFYDVAYPWEIEFSYSDPYEVTSLESVEYELECYKYFNRNDRFHILEENFDRAIIYNSEQCSGLLKLIPRVANRPFLILQYPRILTSSTEIEVSKQEQKYRFNQFWDLTKNRGQFTLNWRLIFNTLANGYKKNLNPNNIDYNKEPKYKKKIRHNSTILMLRKNVSGNVKMLLLLSSLKSAKSFR